MYSIAGLINYNDRVNKDADYSLIKSFFEKRFNLNKLKKVVNCNKKQAKEDFKYVIHSSELFCGSCLLMSAEKEKIVYDNLESFLKLLVFQEIKLVAFKEDGEKTL